MPDFSTPKGVAKWMKVVSRGDYVTFSPKDFRSFGGIAKCVKSNAATKTAFRTTFAPRAICAI